MYKESTLQENYTAVAVVVYVQFHELLEHKIMETIV